MNLKSIMLVLIFSPIAWANQSLPDDYLLTGKSSFSVLFWDVYDIQLKTPSGTYHSGDTPLMLELIYKRDITKEDLVAETLKQWRRFDLEESKKQQWSEKLLSLWPNVIEGDEISLHVDVQLKTKFYYNKRFVGEIADPIFSQAFIAIWLAKDGPYPRLTKELIGEIQRK